MQDFFDFGPQLPGYEHAGAEPTIKQLIYSYYRKHFSEQESEDSTKEYIEQFLKQYKEI